MKILCGTDFSACSGVAARIAVELADRTFGRVELLHVVTPEALDPFAGAADSIVADNELRATAQARLGAAAREVEAVAGAVDLHLSEGAVEQCLVDRGREIEAELIVIGAHGHSRLERMFLGSAAERTLRRADRPVLIVPSGVQAPLRRKGSGPLKIMVAVDDGPASDGALAFVRRLRASGPCDLVLLRLYWPIEEYQRLGLTGPRDLFAADPEVVRVLERSLRERAEALPGVGAVSVMVEPAWGTAAERILEVAHTQGCNLVIVGAESRHGLARLKHPAVADRVARHASTIPVLFVPPPPVSPSHEGAVPRFSTVLMATDFSTAANHAVPFAYSLLAGSGGVVELCHVHERALASPAYAYAATEHHLTAQERQATEERLRALIPSAAESLGITTHVTVIDGGRAAEAIVQASERLAADAIVLGAHSGTRVAIGSVAHAVAHSSRRPVVLIPPAPST